MHSDVLRMAMSPHGVSLDELKETLGPAAFAAVDDMAEENIVWLDDQQGIVYATGSTPSPGLRAALKSYTRKTK
jgi:hypothetical protein